MTQYKGIHHLAMITNDMNKTIRFWRDLLGMGLIITSGDGRNRHYFFEISPNNTIAFFEWPEANNPEMKEQGTPTDEPMCFDHVAIGVENDRVLNDIKKKLSDAGYWVSAIIDHGYIHSIYSYDPNNIPIEFCAEVEGIDIRKNPLMKDINPCKEAKENH